jgi:hypothetical protein
MQTAHSARGGDFDIGRWETRAGSEEHVKPDIVAILEAVKRWQASTHVHPLTCGVQSTHRPLVAIEAEEQQVVLCCLDCDYRQSHIPDVVLMGVPELPKHIKKQIDEISPERQKALTRVPDLYREFRTACEEHLRVASSGDTGGLTTSEARLLSIKADIEKTIASLMTRTERSSRKRRTRKGPPLRPMR